MGERLGGAKAMPASSANRGGGGANGGLIMAIGVLFIVFWIVCLVTQITTNEAWLSGQSNVNILQPDWSVVVQPILFLWGGNRNQAVVLFGWGIEVLYAGFAVAGVALIHGSIHQAGKILGFVFEVIAYGAIALNWYTDYSYGSLGSGQWGHAAFATMTAFVVGTFGNIGMFLIRYGYSKA